MRKDRIPAPTPDPIAAAREFFAARKPGAEPLQTRVLVIQQGLQPDGTISYFYVDSDESAPADTLALQFAAALRRAARERAS